MLIHAPGIHYQCARWARIVLVLLTANHFAPSFAECQDIQTKDTTQRAATVCIKQLQISSEVALGHTI
jgi:hypothetical protein